jgi:two-component sensor histidine kinase
LRLQWGGLSLSDEVASQPSGSDASVPGVMAPDFRAVFEGAPRPLLLMAADAPRFTMLAVNGAHARAFATTPEALAGWGVLEVFGVAPEPEAAAFRDAIQASLEAVMATRAADTMAVRPYAVAFEGGETSERYWSAVNSPIFDSDGNVTHIISAVQDVTGEVLERRSEEARTLLMREVDHRARNALTIVQSIVRLTETATLEDYRNVLSGRVEALARAQTSLAARRWEGGWLSDVIEAELAALANPGQYRLSGPQVELPADYVQPLSMVMHELATNSFKYGGLFVQGGTLAITWNQDPHGIVNICWSEDGMEAVEPPVRQGFGSYLIGQLARQMRGEVSYDWRQTGLRVDLRLTL